MTTSSAEENRTVSPAPQTSMSQRQQTIVLHDGGDVMLLVGKAGSIQQPIQASKTAMSLASSVWKAMFSRAWAEHEVSEISLCEDDVEAMLLLLRIAHLRFQDLPGEGQLSIDSLYDLAVVCDKYDLVHLVRPFLDLRCWADPYFPIIPVRSFVAKNCHPAWLFIAWTFGYGESFTSLSRYLVTQMSITPEGVPMVRGQHFPEHMPPGLLDEMMILREEALTSMLDGCYDNLRKVQHGPVCKQKPPSELDCRCMILGSYMSFLLANSLYPQRPLAAYPNVSVQGYSDMFGTLRIRTHESHDYKALRDQAEKLRTTSHYSPIPASAYSRENIIGHGIIEHKTCGEVVDIATQAQQICAQIPSPVLDEHRVHMAAQAKK